MTKAVLPGPGELSPQVILELQQHGGHVGFMSMQTGLKPDFWLDRRIPAFLKRYFNTEAS
jgi:predicted alpha/beta-fold hydrolase